MLIRPHRRIGGASVSLADILSIVLKTSIFLTVLSLGLRTSAREVVSLAREPRRLVRSTVAMMVIMPAVAVAIALSFDLHPAVKIALVALSVSPVPPVWPKRAIKWGGDESFSLGLLVATAALAVAVIPIAMAAFQRLFALPLEMSADSVGRMVLVTILLPLFLGITIRQLVPSFAQDVASPLNFIATTLLVAGVIPVLVKLSPAAMSLVGDGTLAAMVAFVATGLAAGHLLGGTRRDERSVLALACATRHPAIAVAIAHVNFPNMKLVPAAIVLYLVVAAVVSTPYLKWMNRPAGRRTQVTAPASGFRLRVPR
jgi:bile acid:Na+ symporter, BASS family